MIVKVDFLLPSISYISFISVTFTASIVSKLLLFVCILNNQLIRRVEEFLFKVWEGGGTRDYT